MLLGNRIEGAIFVVGGLYLIFRGITSDYLINESEVSATEEERENAKATPLKRATVIAMGVLSVAFGLYRTLR
jgi:hypothetical protein